MYIVSLLNEQKASQPHTAASWYAQACRRGEGNLLKFKLCIRVGKGNKGTEEVTLVNMMQVYVEGSKKLWSCEWQTSWWSLKGNLWKANTSNFENGTLVLFLDFVPSKGNTVVLIPQSHNYYVFQLMWTCPTAPTLPPGPHYCSTVCCYNYISICKANHMDVARWCFEKQLSLISIFAPRVPNLFHNYQSSLTVFL